MLNLLSMIAAHRQRTALLVLALTPCTVSMAENWPSWRGPRGDGSSTESELPMRWSRDDNVRWRTELPEPGNSTPIVWEDRVFLTQATDGGQRRTVLCLDRKSGKRLWQSGVDAQEMEPTHQTNPYCSPSPVCDAEQVIAWFGSAGLVAFDHEGNQQWQRELGKVEHVFGYGASPILHGNLCILNFGPGTREFAVAVDKTNGRIVWRFDAPRPPGSAPSPGGSDIHGTWSTPIVVDNQLIFCFRDEVSAFEPTTGKRLWRCGGLGPQMKTSPVAGQGVVVALGGRDSSTLAVRLGGSGDVSQSHLQWKYPRANSRLGTGVIHGGHLYANRRNGVIECIELETGNVVWDKRHRGKGNTGDTWSSLFLGAGRIYAINQSADVFVLEAAPDYKLLATNSLGEYTNSTVVGSQGNLFIRTHEALWCIGK